MPKEQGQRLRINNLSIKPSFSIIWHQFIIMKCCFVWENWVKIEIALNSRCIPTAGKRVLCLNIGSKTLFQINEQTVWCENNVYTCTWKSTTVFVQCVLIAEKCLIQSSWYTRCWHLSKVSRYVFEWQTDIIQI